MLPVSLTQSKELGWGKLTLQVRGQTLWGCIPGQKWPLVDFLSGLARIWPWLTLEEGYPIKINPEHVGLMMTAAEQHWDDLPPSRAEAEEDTLFDFRQRHDLSLLFRGLNVSPLWLLREGLSCQVWSPSLAQVIYLPHQEVMAGLTDLGNFLVRHMESQVQPAVLHSRATKALERWAHKQKNTRNAYLPIVTGLTQSEIESLQNQMGIDSPVMHEFLHVAINDDEFFQANELQLAARMSHDSLDTQAQSALLQAIQAIPHVDTAKLDFICQQVPPVDERDAPFQQGYQLAHWLRVHLGFTADTPLNPEDIIQEQLGIPIYDMKISGPIDAVAVWGANHGPAIFINRHSLSRASTVNGQRTTLAHEICHLLIDRKNALPVVEVLGGQVARFAEKRANAFAAELLLPRSTAAAICREQTGLVEAAQQLQEQFKLSREVVYRQIKNSEAGMTLGAVENNELDLWRQEGAPNDP